MAAAAATQRQEEEVAAQSEERAEAALLEGQYSKAFAHYMLVIRLQPAKKADVKDKLSLSLRELGEELVKNGQVKELFTAYQQACQLYPECETILNDMGTQLFRLGYLDEAACCFRRALKVDPDFLGARTNLENMCCHLVERWHFRMLNDRRRNESFQSAIHQAIKDGYDTVLDIGAGTGLLSLYAVEGGARSVRACEMSKTMFELACDVVATNQMADKIHLLHKKSTEITVPNDLPERVSLVVTETFDAGLLGEHILTTLQHAWRYLLKEDHSQCRVIPERAKVFACALECESIRKQNRMLYPGLQHIDLNDVDLLSNTGNNQNHDDSNVDEDDEEEEEEEPYTTERLHSVRGGFKFLSEPIAVAHFNFDSAQHIEEYMAGFCHDLELLVTVNGRVDAIVTWFELYLDKEHCVSSAPGSHSCWEQVIYPVLPQHLMEKDPNENLLVRHGDLLNVSCSCRNNALHFRCNRIARSSQVLSSPLSPSSPSPSVPRHPSHPSSSSSRVITVQGLERQYQPFSLYSSGDPMMSSTVLGMGGGGGAMNGGGGGGGGCYPGLGLGLSLGSSSSSSSNGAHGYTSGHLPSSSTNTSSNHPQYHYHHRERIGSNPSMEYSATYDVDFPPLLKPSVSASNLGTPGYDDQSIPAFLTNTHRSSNGVVVGGSNSNSASNRLSFYLERTDIAFLNDLDYNRELCKALTSIRDSFESPRDFRVIDITQGVSLIPLQAVKIGASEVCIVQNPSTSQSTTQELLCYLTTANALEPERVTFSTQSAGECDAAPEWGVLVAADIVEPCGCLRQQVLDDIALARVSWLRAGDGLVVPHSVSVYAMLIESPALHRDAAVISDDTMCGFLVAALINDFQVTTHLDIELSTLDYKKLSEPFELFTFDFNAAPRDKVPDYLDIQRNIKVKAVETGQVTAAVYWFDMDLSGSGAGVAGGRVCTLQRNMHWRQAAVMQRLPLTVSCGSDVIVRAVCKNSCIGITASLP